MRIRLLASAAVALASLGLAAQASPLAAWSLEEESIVAGNRTMLLFSVTDHPDPPPPDIPQVPGLTIRFAGRMTQLSHTRGQAAQATLYRYSVTSDRPGRYIIGPLRYTLDGQEHRLGPLGLTVTERPDPAQARDTREALSDRLYATLEIGRSPLYQQETTTLDLRIYYANLNLGGEVSLVDFDTQGLEIGRFQEMRATPERINGRLFYVRQFRTWVRPVAAGRFELAPTLRVNLIVREESRRDPLFDDPMFRRMLPESIFNVGRQHPVNLLTRPLAFDVKPLPAEGQPDDFTGAVGQFEFETALDRDAVAVGEPVTIAMTIRGQGNLTEVVPPSYRESEHLRVHSPRLTRSDLSEARISGTRVFEQVVVPRSSAAALPELRFTWFDPLRERYVTRTRGPFDLEITMPDNAAAHVLSGPGPDGPLGPRGVRRLGEDILYLKPLPPLAGAGPAWLAVPAALPAPLLHALPLAAFVGAWLLERRRRWREAHPEAVRRSRAPKAARAGLAEARRAEDGRAIGLALGRTVRDYMGDRLNLEPGEVTSDRVESELARHGLPDDLRGELRAILEFADACAYDASASPDSDTARAHLARLEAVLRAIERRR